MKLYLFRHAAVAQQYQGAYNGHIDIDASQEGLQEAKQNFEPLNKKLFDAVYCSTLKRARQTAKHLKCHKVIYSDDLREKSWGRHEGKRYDEVVAMEGQNYQNFRQWLEVMDGEPYDSLIQRIESFLGQLKTQSYKDVLVVTHAGVIYTIVHLLRKIPLEEAFQQSVGYGSYIIVELI